MSDMRKLINLFEGAVPSLTDDPDTIHDVDSDIEVDHDGERLEGVSTLSLAMINDKFPSVKQPQIFYSGWLKIMANKEEALTPIELWELGRAFVDIIRMDEREKMKLFRKLILVRMPPGSEDEPTRIMRR